MNFSEEKYEEMIGKLFVRFPSFQKAGAGAYKPGMAGVIAADELMGHPHRNYRIIHVAGTNGKGSVSNMLASSLAASGYKVGLYTSPHILDFRERMRVVDDSGCRCVSKRYVWDFMCRWNGVFDALDMSFFEITTMMALEWFASEKVDVTVLETGLGGRLDSTNIVTPVLSIITNIGYDHCDLLGDTLPEIAFEKAGIIKPLVPVVVGESSPDTDAVFERKVLYVNLSEAKFMGNRSEIMSLLTFADKVEPELWKGHDEILAAMDLQGEYQRRNLRTVLAALDVLGAGGLSRLSVSLSESPETVVDAIVHTASRTDFHGRWEKLSDSPLVICDIGHNEHGLKYNFAQLERMRSEGKCSGLIIVYGSVADKDVDSVMHIMPEDGVYVFTQAQGRRALPAVELKDRFLSYRASSGKEPGSVFCEPDVRKAVGLALSLAAGSSAGPAPVVYIGGSTYVVSEAVSLFGQTAQE